MTKRSCASVWRNEESKVMFRFVPSVALVLLMFVLVKGIAADGLQRIKYNHPGLGVGLWAWPVPWDVDGDGDRKAPTRRVGLRFA